MTQVQWAEPALLWGTQTLDRRQQPQLLELKSDDFLPDFLAAMQTKPDKKAISNPVATSFLSTAQMSGPTLKLYQPLHSRYYLVTASLVCHQVGLPDKEVNIKKGEKTTFVLRRTQNGVEQGWSDKRGWVTIEGADSPVASDEEQFPAHPVSVCTGKEGTIVPCERKIYYGYVATGNRDKYLDKKASSLPSTALPEEKIKKFFSDANAGLTDDQQKIDYRLDQFDTKVIAAWDFLNRSTADKTAIEPGSTNILLEFADFLQRSLPVFWAAIQANSNANLSQKPAELDLFAFLTSKTIQHGFSPATVTTITLKDALRDSALDVNLLNRQQVALPITLNYNVTKIANDAATQKSRLNTLKDKVQAALAEEPSSATFTSPENAEEVVNLIENQVRPASKDGADDVYFLRMIYDYDPTCPPIPSEASLPFTIARFLEPDAPARLIRIEMPSIKPADLRKFRHGVGLQMSPELRKVMDGVNEGMLKGEGLGPATEWQLGMICTFSIQIITLIAFILMFIIAIVLNIIFWWLAFLKICLPIPKKA